MTAEHERAPIDSGSSWRWIRQIADAVRAERFDGRLADNGHRLEVDAAGAWRLFHRDGLVPAIAPEAAELLSVWLPWVVGDVSRGPQVIAQLGQSLDGRIATVTGASHYVTGQASLVHLHRTRALVDAVVVGAGTVEADDPQLTVRHVEGRHPLRVVLDPRGRVSPGKRVFSEAAAPTWHLLSEGRESVVRAAHVTAHRLADTAAGVDPAAVIALLVDQGCRRILIEGGGVTVSRFLAAGQLDRLHSVVAPMIIGSGRPAITLPTIETLDDALRPACRQFSLGDDRLFDFDLRPCASHEGAGDPNTRERNQDGQ